MTNESTIIVVAVIVFVIAIALFFLLREINCWYFKINERILLQKEIIALLKNIAPNNTQNETTLKEESNKENLNDLTHALSSDEKELVNEILKKGFKEGDKIIMHKSLKNILKVTEIEWHSYGSYQKDWIILKQ